MLPRNACRGTAAVGVKVTEWERLLIGDEVRLAEIEKVQDNILNALVRTNQPTTLSEDEQDSLLAQACSEACGILDRWVKSTRWEELRPKAHEAIADVIPDWQAIRPFLAPLAVTLGRMTERRPSVAGIPEIGKPADYIDDLIMRTESTSRRHPGFTRKQLYTEATNRIKTLQSSVCALAGDFAKGAKNRARLRAAARSALKAAAGFLFSAALISIGLTQQAVAHDLTVAVHEAVSVAFVVQAAHTAQPTVRVAPPQLGAHLGPGIG
jgi:hypothetical protein